MNIVFTEPEGMEGSGFFVGFVKGVKTLTIRAEWIKGRYEFEVRTFGGQEALLTVESSLEKAIQWCEAL